MRNVHHNVMKALDEVSDLIQWWDTDIGADFGRWFMAQVMEGSTLTLNEPERFARQEIYRLSHSPLYWVERDMVDLLTSAVQTFPTKRLWPEDLPSPSGFVYFEKPIFLPDRHGKLIGLKAFEWFTQPLEYAVRGKSATSPMGALSLSFYDHADFADHDEGPFWKGTSAKLGLYHYLPWSFGAGWTVDEEGNYRMNLPLTDANRPPTQEEWEDLLLSLRDEREDELPDGASSVPAQANIDMGAGWYPLVDCLWTLLQQRITHLGAHQPDRHTGRRIKKVLPDPEIQIVTLRRPAGVYHGDVGEPRPVEWSRRWIVEGHWRWQWYAKEQKHRRIYITPFIKGPEDKPLVVKDKVYAWKR